MLGPRRNRLAGASLVGECLHQGLSRNSVSAPPVSSTSCSRGLFVYGSRLPVGSRHGQDVPHGLSRRVSLKQVGRIAGCQQVIQPCRRLRPNAPVPRRNPAPARASAQADIARATSGLFQASASKARRIVLQHAPPSARPAAGLQLPTPGMDTVGSLVSILTTSAFQLTLRETHQLAMEEGKRLVWLRKSRQTRDLRLEHALGEYLSNKSEPLPQPTGGVDADRTLHVVCHR